MEREEKIMNTAGSKEQTQILKGKRKKRQRPQSPIPFSLAPPNSLYMVDDEASSDDESKDMDTNKNLSDDNYYINGVTSSASSSSNNVNRVDMSTDEEDQDMANCLILLAQGQSIIKESKKDQLAHFNDMGTNNNTHRFSSRRFLETSSNNGINGKAGYYVYQCKTCDRTFPSFQALGGHRASHKKPRAIYADEKKNNNIVVKELMDEEDRRYNRNHHSPVYTRGLMYGNNNNNHGKVSHKVHECGVCGAEFTSGQALGGHMRRHRGAVVAAGVANTALSLSPLSFDQTEGQDLPAKRARNSLSLDLDLNLPAPEDENRENGIGFASKQEQEQQELEEHKQQKEPIKPLVLSAATLVDCHY